MQNTMHGSPEALAGPHRARVVPPVDRLAVRRPPGGFGDDRVFYWRSISHREVDFVIRRGRDRVDLVECKINPDQVERTAIDAFRVRYPEGDNYVVSPGVKQPYRIRRGDRVMQVCGTADLG